MELTKKQINDFLKDLGLTTVKMSKHEFDHSTVACMQTGQRERGIPGGSVGPMTCTSAYKEFNGEVSGKVRRGFGDYLYREGLSDKVDAYVRDRRSLYDFYVIPLVGGGFRILQFKFEQFPTYSPMADLDPGYKTYWYVLTVVDTK